MRMLNITVASGKGGTGKTTVAVNLALAMASKQSVQLLDCDVEEPNDHLFIKPVIERSWKTGIPVPQVDYQKCDFCGRCAEVCAFNALAVLKDYVMLLNELCHGCGSCAYFCPQKAITETERTIGTVESGRAANIEFAHGCLNPGEAMSPPLINEVKKLANRKMFTIFDAPPGTSCPVISALSGSDYCLLITEPTPFGLNDLDLAHQVAKLMEIPAGVVINRSDVGNGRVEQYCREHNIPVLLKIPFDRRLAELYARGEPVVLHSPGWESTFKQLYEQIVAFAEGGVRR